MASKDEGIIATLLQRFETQRLPRALSLKKKVDAGETLGSLDLSFIEEVLQDAKQIEPMLNDHPEYTELVSKAYALYKDIVEKSLQNENR